MRLKNMKLIQYLLVSSIGLLLFACTETDGLETHAGKTGFMISLADGSVGVEARAVPSALPDPAKTAFQIQVLKAGTANSVADVHYEENQLIEVEAGVYDVVATYGDVSALALDAPCYRGIAEDQTVSVDKTTSVTINCTVANALLSVKYDDSVKKFSDIYSDYYVKVSVNGASLDIKDTKESAYFQPETPFEVYFCATKQGENVEKSMKLNLSQTSLKAAEHLILTLSPEPDKSGADISVTKEEIKSVTINETIPMEWLPKPKVEAEGFVGNELSMVETETPTAKFNFDLSDGLQELKFTLNFADETYQSLNKQYVLSELSEGDRKALTEAGVVLPEIGSKEAALDFTGLAAKLTGKEGETLNNVITLDEVKANNRVLDNSQNYTYTIKTQAPEFGIMVYPGNTWTKQFTANTEITTGNADVINSEMTFEYSLNGSDWTSSESNLIANLTPGTTYQVRGKFGKHVSEVVEVKTYEALDIPNSSLDDGYTTTYPKKDNPLYTFNGDWIDTRNELTCHDDGINAFYVSKSSTLPISENGSTVAHMMVIGWGNGNTCVGNKGASLIYHISSGIVCVGDYDVSNDAINAKQAYIRPTSLSFTYKASPYNGDEYLVEVSLLNITDNVETMIGEGKLQSGSAVADYSTGRIDISYDESKKELPISHVKVLFKAGTKEDRDHLEDEFRDYKWYSSSNAYIIGSQFWLDSFQFNYDK